MAYHLEEEEEGLVEEEELEKWTHEKEKVEVKVELMEEGLCGEIGGGEGKGDSCGGGVG